LSRPRWTATCSTSQPRSTPASTTARSGRGGRR
jgi:hypothetical protein